MEVALYAQLYEIFPRWYFALILLALGVVRELISCNGTLKLCASRILLVIVCRLSRARLRAYVCTYTFRELLETGKTGKR